MAEEWPPGSVVAERNISSNCRSRCMLRPMIIMVALSLSRLEG